MLNIWVAYALWFFGGLGTLGLHRFYMRKIPTGVIWILTGGGFLVGTIYDFFTMTRLIAEANGRAGWLPGPGRVEVTVHRDKEPLERVILRTAEHHAGRVSAVQVAAASDWTLDQAQKALDDLARRRVCEVRVLSSGAVVYHFAEFDPSSTGTFEA